MTKSEVPFLTKNNPRKNFQVNFHLILGHFARKIRKKPGNRGIYRDLDGKKVEKLVFFTWKRDSRCPFSRHQEKINKLFFWPKIIFLMEIGEITGNFLEKILKLYLF